ncbi:MAG: A/G-specific adenine glycosylase, partial [Phycisphaerales bacterium]
MSELMLQQTQVSRVIGAFERFVERFPTAAALAGAPEGEVLAAWQGLGYYRRARLLQAAARTVVERHGGEVPRSEPELRALPGIGRYTAGAIASIAFGECVPIVDGNVLRVLS